MANRATVWWLGWGGGFLLFRMNERLVDWRADRLDESPTYILRPKPATALIQQPWSVSASQPRFCPVSPSGSPFLRLTPSKALSPPYLCFLLPYLPARSPHSFYPLSLPHSSVPPSIVRHFELLGWRERWWERRGNKRKRGPVSYGREFAGLWRNETGEQDGGSGGVKRTDDNVEVLQSFHKSIKQLPFRWYNSLYPWNLWP